MYFEKLRFQNGHGKRRSFTVPPDIYKLKMFKKTQKKKKPKKTKKKKKKLNEAYEMKWTTPHSLQLHAQN